MRYKVIALKNEAYRVVSVGVPVSVLVFLCGNTVNDKVTRGIVIKTSDDVKKRCLAAARMSEDGNKFAFTEVKAHAPEGRHHIFSASVFLNDLL